MNVHNERLGECTALIKNALKPLIDSAVATPDSVSVLVGGDFNFSDAGVLQIHEGEMANNVGNSAQTCARFWIDLLSPLIEISQDEPTRALGTRHRSSIASASPCPPGNFFILDLIFVLSGLLLLVPISLIRPPSPSLSVLTLVVSVVAGLFLLGLPGLKSSRFGYRILLMVLSVRVLILSLYGLVTNRPY